MGSSLHVTFSGFPHLSAIIWGTSERRDFYWRRCEGVFT